MYEFLFWTAILGVVWLLAFGFWPQLRKKMWWSSLVALPFGIGELYFIPNYWTPQTLFNLGMTYRVDIESFILMFFLGGIAAAVYEGLFKARVPLAQKFCHSLCRCYVSFIATLVVFIVLTRAFPDWNIIYPSSFACLLGGITAMLLYPQLRKHILFGGALFAFLYWSSLAITELISPWILATWNISALSGKLVLGVPIEEILFGFSFGTIWTALFEETCSNFNIGRKHH